MYSYVFLLGRPGCGKSVVYHKLSEQLLEKGLIEEVKRIDDFPVLQEILKEDKGLAKHIEKEGGFEVTDLNLLDDVLKRINQNIREIQKPKKLIFIEFSRNNYDHALENFDQEILNQSLIIYIYCPLEVCIKRNIHRFKEGRETTDNHIVPSDMMKKYYVEDDYENLFLEPEEDLKKQTPARVIVVKNDVEGLDRLKEELGKVIDVIKKANS